MDTKENVCMEEDCRQTEYLVPCRLVVYRGEVPLMYIVRFQGLRAAWDFIRRGWYKETYYYCASHCQKNGFCYGCGEFWAGSESFDFGPGYCSNCAGEFEDDWDDDDGYYGNDMPDDYYAQEYEAEPDYEEGE